MTYVLADNLHLHYPVHNAATQSFQLDLYRRLGGRLAVHEHVLCVEALRGLSFELVDGARVGLIGNNGAGKTTLLRMLAGVYPPTHGRVKVEGRVTPFTDVQLGMDMEATGRENIVFRSVFMGMTFAEARARVDQIAEFSELGDLLDMPVRTYSQGMFMRLAFSISTSTEPEIMIMDEMIGAGDKSFIKKVNERLHELVDKTRILIVASHNPGIIKRFCSQVIWLERGEIKRLGPIEDVLDEYLKDG